MRDQRSYPKRFNPRDLEKMYEDYVARSEDITQQVSSVNEITFKRAKFSFQKIGETISGRLELKIFEDGSDTSLIITHIDGFAEVKISCKRFVQSSSKRGESELWNLEVKTKLITHSAWSGDILEKIPDDELSTMWSKRVYFVTCIVDDFNRNYQSKQLSYNGLEQ